MFRSLRYHARSWSVVWRARLLVYRLKRGFGWLVLPALPIAALGCIVHVAYSDHMRSEAARRRHVDLHCLAQNVYFEARGEPPTGQRAVAEVTLNRVASPRFPDRICEVVHEVRWDPLRRRRVAAFSWTEQPDPPTPGGVAWRRALSAATAVYDQASPPVVSGALFYHATSIEPYWARAKQSVATIGNHVFYR
jgi:spore germination cell wall hydrolase CwlJ-like protein